MSETHKVSSATANQMTNLGYEQLQSATWRSTASDVMVFVSVHANTDEPCAMGHLTKRNPGTGATVKPYSQSYRVPFVSDVDAAVLCLAQHMLLVAEEHAIAGTVKFQRFSGHGESEVVDRFN